jgi:hypothetical protein
LEKYSNRHVVEYFQLCLDTGEEFDDIMLFNDYNTILDVENSKFKPISMDDLLQNTSRCKTKLTHLSHGKNVAIHSAFESLQKFLFCLEIPVIPLEFQIDCVTKGSESFKSAQMSISKLPTCHYNAFIYITSFLNMLVQKYHGNGNLSPKLLGIIQLI